MRNIYFSFLSFTFLLLFPGNILGQDSLNQKSILPEGLSFEFGIGSYAVTDEYISKEKYSGTLPLYKIKWINQHENYLYQLGMEFRTSSRIKNYNVSAKIFQLILNQGFLYLLPEFTLFSKKAYVYAGPSTDIFGYYNKQNIAVSGFDYSQSFAFLISLGFNSEFYYPIADNLSIEGSLNFSVLSLGIRLVDTEETDESPVKPLTFLSGVNSSLKFGLRYYLFDNFSVNTSYVFSITRITAWDPLLSASDNLVFNITYTF